MIKRLGDVLGVQSLPASTAASEANGSTHQLTNEDIERILADPGAYFEALGRPRWTCSVCGTTYNGVVMRNPALPGGLFVVKPPVKGHCPQCEEAEFRKRQEQREREEKRRVADLFLRWSDIGPSYLRCTFDNFEPRKGTRAALEAARAFAERLRRGEDGGRWLLLFGDPGCGKTHLGMAIRNAAEEAGMLAIATTQPHILKEIQASWRRRPAEASPDDRSEDWMLEKLQTAKVLLWDDLGPWKDWANEMMFAILDSRYRNRRPTVFTSNYTPEELEQIMGPALWSRFAARTEMIPVTATDYRIEVERQQLRGGGSG